VKLRQQKAPDQVQVAEAALKLAKVNKATHAANAKARRTTRLASSLATKRIQFAQIMLASRLKAIKSTQHLTSDKSQLKAQSLVAEAQEALVTAKQQVLMSFRGVDNMKLDEIVGKSYLGNTFELSTTAQSHQSTGSGASEAIREFDGALEQSPNLGKALRDEDLIDSQSRSLTRAPEDEIFTQKMHTCTFPFKYNGKKYFRCKQSQKGHWCATKVSADHKIQQWDYCVLNKRAVALAKQAAMEAAKIEIKRMLSTTGAKISPAALRASLRAAAAAQQKPGTHKADAAGKKELEKKKLASKPPSESPAVAKKKVDAMINQDVSSDAVTLVEHLTHA
jgi:hypothetical protein